MTDGEFISCLNERVVSGPVTTGAGLPGHWRAVPYETEAFNGVLLGCGHATRPEPVRLRLGAKGVHRIWLGLFGAYRNGHIRVRLTGDLCCTSFKTPDRDVIEPPVMHEMLWKDCDVTGQDIILEGGYDRKPLPGALAFIRLAPVENLPSPACPEIWRPMVISNDGHGEFRKMPHHRPEDILEDLEGIPDQSCMRSLLWGNGDADNCNYPTSVGNPLCSDGWQDPFVVCDREITIPNMRLWRESGWNSLRLIREYTRRRQWELHVYIRMQAFSCTYPNEELLASEFFHAHPDWHCRDREGNRVNRLSYAWPGVQEHMIELIREILEYEPDGVCLCLTRGVPMMLYEPVMVDGFMARHGQDPRDLDELDPRWLDYQANVFTGFVCRVAELVGHEKRLSVMVPGNPADLRRWGFDVERWVRDGIIADLYPVGQRFNVTNTHYDAPEALDFDYFQSLPGRNHIRLVPCLYPWTLYYSNPEAFRRLVRSFLERGADQYCIWDGHQEYDHRKIGDIGIKDWEGPAYAPKGSEVSRLVNVLALNGFRVDRYGACECV